MSEFKGKTAIVTGGAQGMGLQYVRLLAQAGANVVIADVNVAAAQTAADGLGFPGQIFVVKTDVSSVEDCTACAAAAAKKFGGVDYLVNNAGLLSAAAYSS